MDGTFRTHSITTPLSLLITSPDDYMVQSYFLVGGYYSYHIGGKVNDSSLDFQNDYKNQEFGLSYGFGLQVMNFQLGISFRRGLTNLLQPDILPNRCHWPTRRRSESRVSTLRTTLPPHQSGRDQHSVCQSDRGCQNPSKFALYEPRLQGSDQSRSRAAKAGPNPGNPCGNRATSCT